MVVDAAVLDVERWLWLSINLSDAGPKMLQDVKTLFMLAC